MDDQIYTTSTEVENLESTLVNCTIAQVTGMTAKRRHGIAHSFTWKSSCKTLFAKQGHHWQNFGVPAYLAKTSLWHFNKPGRLKSFGSKISSNVIHLQGQDEVAQKTEKLTTGSSFSYNPFFLPADETRGRLYLLQLCNVRILLGLEKTLPIQQGFPLLVQEGIYCMGLSLQFNDFLHII